MSERQENFSLVALTLINYYDSVYYVDINTGKYTDLVPFKLFKKIGIPFQGDNFFEDTIKNASKCAHPKDLEIINKTYNQKKMQEHLSKSDVYSVIYRLIIDGTITHMRHFEFLCPDREHVICCLENVEDEYKKNEEQLRNLESAERMARFDELTGVRNKNAYHEYIQEINDKLKSDNTDYHFGIILCDMNDLKLINDTRGHSFGDEAIQRSSRMICNIFTHSPVFRIGGDEFVVILTGQDYENRESLLKALGDENRANLHSRSGPIVASGIAVYEPEADNSFSDVFNRADKAMYKNKHELKSINLKQGIREIDRTEVTIDSERKRQLDALFGALYTVAGGGYVYLTDMHYDFSRWSLPLVDDFGMQSEYMYHADKLWQERVHSDDIKAYKEAVDAVFCNNSATIQPLTYRARKTDGTYILLSTRGFILNDKNGNPDYFGGIIITM